MSLNTNIKKVTVAAAGYSATITPSDPYEVYEILGTDTLVGNITINTSGSPTTPKKVKIAYKGVFTLNGFAINFLGNVLTSDQALSGNVTVYGIWDMSSWKSWIHSQPPVPYTVKNTVFVSKSGNDATGIAERADKAFLTLAAAITAASALTPSITQRIKIQVAAGNYSSALKLTLPTFVDLDLGNASIICTDIGQQTIQLAGTSCIYGDGAAIINLANGVALYTAGAGNNSIINVALIRGGIDMDLGGGFMQIFAANITPTQTNVVSGFINATFVNGGYQFQCPDCYSGLEFGASTSSLMTDTFLRNGLAVTGDGFLEVYNTRIRRTIPTTQATAVALTATASLYLSNARIECTDATCDGIYTDSRTALLRLRGCTIVAGGAGGTFSINNDDAGGAWVVKDYSGNTMNIAAGGASAVTDSIGTWIVNAGVV